MLRFLYDSLNAWMTSGVIFFQVKEMIAALSIYVGHKSYKNYPGFKSLFPVF